MVGFLWWDSYQILTFVRLAFAFLSEFDAWGPLFLMARWPMILFFMSCAWDSMFWMSFTCWLRTVFLVAKLMSGILRCSGVPNFAMSDLFSTVSCWPGTFTVMVLFVDLTSAATSGIAS